MAPTSKTNIEAGVESERALATPKPFTFMFVLAPVVGWLVPGLGHIIQKRWVRGLLLAASIFALFLLGLAMQGKVYDPNTGDVLDMLGFVGDIGAGGLYFVTKTMGGGEGAIYRAVADYGTKYIIAAGLLNIISAIDAYHIACGKKN